jgi:hypothetical protein
MANDPLSGTAEQRIARLQAQVAELQGIIRGLMAYVVQLTPPDKAGYDAAVALIKSDGFVKLYTPLTYSGHEMRFEPRATAAITVAQLYGEATEPS